MVAAAPRAAPAVAPVFTWVRAFSQAATARAARSIRVVRGKQRGGRCHGHRVLGLARARTGLRV